MRLFETFDVDGSEPLRNYRGTLIGTDRVTHASYDNLQDAYEYLKAFNGLFPPSYPADAIYFTAYDKDANNRIKKSRKLVYELGRLLL